MLVEPVGDGEVSGREVSEGPQEIRGRGRSRLGDEDREDDAETEELDEEAEDSDEGVDEPSE